MRFILLLLSVCVSTPSIAESDWHTSFDGTAYGYLNGTNLRSNSVLNPDNQFAQLAQRSDHLETRLNLKAESDTLLITARPIVAINNTHNTFGDQQSNEAYLSQWQVRMHVNDVMNLAAGREVLNWGVAQFRSPSSPFYFDSGRSNPVRELAGVDMLKAFWITDKQGSVQLVRVLGSGYKTPQPDIWRNAWLLKVDRHGKNWAAGLAILKTPDQSAFFGANGQFTASDALLAYAELSSATRSNALNSPANTALPFSISSESSRETTGLIGATYTFENGKSFSAEYLHDSQGYSTAEEHAYFLRADNQPAMALGLAPRLLGRDYIHMVLQSNLLESNGYWRLMMTHSITDGSNELSGYGEITVNNRLSAFAIGTVHVGNARQEFSALTESSLTLGLKVALP